MGLLHRLGIEVEVFVPTIWPLNCETSWVKSTSISLTIPCIAPLRHARLSQSIPAHSCLFEPSDSRAKQEAAVGELIEAGDRLDDREHDATAGGLARNRPT
jgi:hypothetical protein